MDILQSPIRFSKNDVGKQGYGYKLLNWLGFNQEEYRESAVPDNRKS
jgi:hypothetical protein